MTSRAVLALPVAVLCGLGPACAQTTQPPPREATVMRTIDCDYGMVIYWRAGAAIIQLGDPAKMRDQVAKECAERGTPSPVLGPP